MTKPITPREIQLGRHIPDEVFEAFNELFAETRGNVTQDVILVPPRSGKTPAQDLEAADFYVTMLQRASESQLDRLWSQLSPTARDVVARRLSP